MTQFKTGNIVDITITGALIHEYHEIPDDMPEVTVMVESDAGTQFLRLPIGWPTVNIAAGAPAEWPPQPGDLWRDAEDLLWFAVESLRSEGRSVLLTCNGRSRRPVEDIRQLHSPLTLVHREGGEDA